MLYSISIESYLNGRSKDYTSIDFNVAIEATSFFNDLEETFEKNKIERKIDNLKESDFILIKQSKIYDSNDKIGMADFVRELYLDYSVLPDIQNKTGLKIM